MRARGELERALHEHVTLRFLGGGYFANFRTICSFSSSFRQLFAAFRKRHVDDFSYLFSEVLQIAEKMDILKLGTVRLSVDGAKFKANVSKLKNIVYKIIADTDKDANKANDYINKLVLQLTHRLW